MSRVRSLYKEKADGEQFRHHRNRNIGHSISNEFYQPCPFFFTRESAQVNVIGNYRGSSAFLICNGPSIVNGDYDLSLLKLPGVITMGINNGPKTIRPNFWTCVDDPKRFLLSIWLDPTIQKIVPHAHAEKKLFDSTTWKDSDILVGQCPNVLYYHRNAKFHAERWLYEDTINWGNTGEHGGCRSVMLPALRILFLLGFRRVYLMGADFTMSEDYTYHFDEQRATAAVKCNLNTYDKMKNEYFPQLKPYFDAEGFEVYNCNQNSGLKVFPYMPFDQAVSECTTRLGDIFNERTWGMYSKPSERQKWVEEPDDSKKSHLVYLQNRPIQPVYAPVMEQNEIVQPNENVQPVPQVQRTPVRNVERHVEEIEDEYDDQEECQEECEDMSPPSLPPSRPPVKESVRKSPPIPRAGNYQQISAPEPKVQRTVVSTPIVTPRRLPQPVIQQPPQEIHQRTAPGVGTAVPNRNQMIPRAPVIPPLANRPQPRAPVAPVAPEPKVTQLPNQKGRIINKVPCGIINGSSANYGNKNITIEDDGR